MLLVMLAVNNFSRVYHYATKIKVQKGQYFLLKLDKNKRHLHSINHSIKLVLG